MGGPPARCPRERVSLQSPHLCEEHAKWDGAKWDHAKWDHAKWDLAKWEPQRLAAVPQCSARGVWCSPAHLCAGPGLAHRQGTPQWALTGILDLHRRNSPSTGETRCVMAPGGMKASAAKWDRAKWDHAKWDLAKWEPQRRCVMAPGGMKAFAAGHARPLSGVLRPSRPSGPSPCGRPAHA
jgi:hypothetical protein